MATTTTDRGGRSLREARTRAGLTRAQLAAEAGCSLAQLANIEQGAVPKRSRVLDSVLAILAAHNPSTHDAQVAEPRASERRAMTALGPQSSARPTRIGVRAIRADLLWRYALERGDRIESIDDVRALCSTWTAPMFWDAWDTNVGLGRFTENATGQLVVMDRPA